MLLFLLWTLGVISIALFALFLASLVKTRGIRGRSVLITGGSSGIGKALAAEALRRGAASVTILARDEGRLEEAKKELEEALADGSDQKVYILSADVSQESVKGVISDAVRAGRHVDILVNCAGITHSAPIHETTSQKFRDMLEVNVLGSVYPTQAVLPGMMQAKWGCIVFISSMAAQIGLYGYTAYSTSKYALRGLAETLQMEVKPHNVAVSISFPPDTDTPQLREEKSGRSSIVKAITAFGDIFEARRVAKEVWNGMERGQFTITHGFDGFLVGTLTAGFAPAHHLWSRVVQCLLMGAIRFVSLIYLRLFYRIVKRGVISEAITGQAKMKTS